MPDRPAPTRPRVAPFVLALVAAALVWMAPGVLDTFSVNVLTRSALYAALAVTVDLLWGFTGILTFGQAAFFGAGAYATAMVLTHLGSSPAWVLAALALAVLVPVALGALVGWLSFYHGSTPLYASVISLVFPIVVTQLVYSGGEWTGSSSGLVGYDTLPLDLPGFFRIAGLFAILVALAAWIFVRSDAGKLLAAVRDNDARCAYLGISPKRVAILLTIVLAGVAGPDRLPFRPGLGRRRAGEHRLPVRHGTRHLGGARRARHRAGTGAGRRRHRLSRRDPVGRSALPVAADPRLRLRGRHHPAARRAGRRGPARLHAAVRRPRRRRVSALAHSWRCRRGRP